MCSRLQVLVALAALVTAHAAEQGGDNLNLLQKPISVEDSVKDALEEAFGAAQEATNDPASHGPATMKAAEQLEDAVNGMMPKIKAHGNMKDGNDPVVVTKKVPGGVVKTMTWSSGDALPTKQQKHAAGEDSKNALGAAHGNMKPRAPALKTDEKPGSVGYVVEDALVHETNKLMHNPAATAEDRHQMLKALKHTEELKDAAKKVLTHPAVRAPGLTGEKPGSVGYVVEDALKHETQRVFHDPNATKGDRLRMLNALNHAGDLKHATKQVLSSGTAPHAPAPLKTAEKPGSTQEALNDPAPHAPATLKSAEHLKDAVDEMMHKMMHKIEAHGNMKDGNGMSPVVRVPHQLPTKQQKPVSVEDAVEDALKMAKGAAQEVLNDLAPHAPATLKTAEKPGSIGYAVEDALVKESNKVLQNPDQVSPAAVEHRHEVEKALKNIEQIKDAVKEEVKAHGNMKDITISLGNAQDQAAPVDYKAAVAEYLAMTLFVVIGCGSAMAVCGEPGWVLQVALTFGLAITSLAYTVGHFSGGQINCAVTLGLVLAGKLTAAQGVTNFVAQILGSLTGALILTLMIPEAADKTGGLGTNKISDKLSKVNAFVGEFLMTFLLMFVVLETAINPATKANREMAALAIGFAVFLAHAVLINVDGCSINPTRTFGPAMVRQLLYKNKADSLDEQLVFWAGPLLGAAGAVAVSTAMR